MNDGDRVRQVKPYTEFPTRGFTPLSCVGRRGTVIKFTPESVLDSDPKRKWPPVVSVKWDNTAGFSQRIPPDALEVLSPVDWLAELSE